MKTKTAPYRQKCKKPKMAVAIAEDVLASIRGERRLHMCGRYMIRKSWDRRNDIIVPVDATDLKAITAQVEETCQVCAMGSLLLSRAKLFDSVPLSEILTEEPGPRHEMQVGQSDCAQHLSDIFDPVTLSMVESAFEATEITNYMTEPDGNVATLLREAAAWGVRLRNGGKTTTKIMAIIARNLVRNKGVLKLPRSKA